MFHRIFSTRGLQGKFLLIALPLVLVATFALFAISEALTYRSAVRDLHNSVAELSASQAAALSNPLWNLDYTQIDLALKALVTNPDVLGAKVFGGDNKLVGKAGTPDSPKADIHAERDIHFSDGGNVRTIGKLVVAMTDARLRSSMRMRFLVAGGIAILVVLCVIASVLLAHRRTIGIPLERLLASINLAHSKKIRQPVSWPTNDEVGAVIAAFNEMQVQQSTYEDELRRARDTLEQRVKERTNALATASKEAQSARQQLVDAIESISEGFALFDSEDRLVISNSRYAEFVSPEMVTEPIAGTTFESIIRSGAARGMVGDSHDHDYASIDEWVAARLERHRNPKGPYLERRADGRWVRINERRTEDGGFVAVYSDITELKQREAELEVARDAAMQANRAKSDFLATMSHELRTPLNAIIGLSEMMVEHGARLSPERSKESLSRVLKAGRYLLRLINEILDLSKIEAGRMELTVESVNVRALMDDIVNTSQALANNNNNELSVDISTNVTGVRADPLRIRQILLNLIGNACKFTSNGRVSVQVRPRATKGGPFIDFSVIDTGIGMTPEQIGRLFQEFVQADASTTRVYGGTGLGLAVSRKLCRLMGGDISVQSELGSGSTFTASLPATTLDLRQPTVPANREDDTGTDPKGSTPEGNVVLVIDDDPTAVELLARHLRSLGFRVESAARGRDGLDRARALHPDAIILDVLMPGLDGWQVLARLKEDPSLTGIPVVMVTIMDEPQRGIAMGAVGYLTKPVDRERLSSMLAPYHLGTRQPIVLVVEDDVDQSRSMQEALTELDYVVDTAGNGHEALERMAAKTPDVIVLDLMMPEMDGYEFMAALQADPARRDIPVLIVTAKDLSSDDRHRLNVGVNNIIEKNGQHRDKLVEQVHRLLKTGLDQVQGAERETPS